MYLPFNLPVLLLFHPLQVDFAIFMSHLPVSDPELSQAPPLVPTGPASENLFAK